MDSGVQELLAQAGTTQAPHRPQFVADQKQSLIMPPSIATIGLVLTPNQVHFQVEKFWFTGTSFL